MPTAENTWKRDKGRNLDTGYFLPSLLHFIILSLIPAFLPCFLSCSDNAFEENGCESEVLLTKSSGSEAVGSVDLFFYNDDKLSRLDSYQRFLSPPSVLTGRSGSGSKTVHAVANSRTAAYSWLDICSVFALGKLRTVLDEDNPSSPVMSGSTRIEAGKEATCGIELRPVMAEVILRSLCCDFSDRIYAGEKLENVRVYLTGVCVSAPLFSIGPPPASEFINIGGLDSTEVFSLRHPEYVYRATGRNVGAEKITPDIHFYCYPNSPDEKSLGSPCTNIVIEGKLGGNTVYYPIEVKQEGGKGEILRNTRYLVDVRITRRGASRIGEPLETDAAIIGVSAEPWTEKDKQYVSF